jgi:twitching motility protein PilU
MSTDLELSALLNLMSARKASDLFLSVGAPPGLKVEGETQALGSTPLTSQAVEQLAYAIMNERQQKVFEAEMEMNLALSVDNVGRFRVNLYRQRGHTAIVIRHISHQIPSIESLNLPEVLKELVMTPRGLVLVAGAAGSGKSTTLASMVDYRNQRKTGHILTIEDPIEYVHSHKESIVDQRELGLDTLSFASALRNAMREAPDVILIGEIRDRETMQAAITYAETGHLCLSTLHANNANQTLDRIVNFFPESAHRQLLLDLSLNLKAVISQRLIRGVDGKRIPAVELLLGTPYVSDLIQKGEFDTLKDAMKQSLERGMMTFDESLFGLYQRGRISYETAIEHADSRTDLSLRIRLSGPGAEDEALQLSSS